jgi:hypothetical protein
VEVTGSEKIAQVYNIAVLIITIKSFFGRGCRGNGFNKPFLWGADLLTLFVSYTILFLFHTFCNALTCKTQISKFTLQFVMGTNVIKPLGSQ